MISKFGTLPGKSFLTLRLYIAFIFPPEFFIILFFTTDYLIHLTFIFACGLSDRILPNGCPVAPTPLIKQLMNPILYILNSHPCLDCVLKLVYSW